MQGWIKLHRQLLDSELWLSDPFTRAQAWVDLILLANHKDGVFFVRGNIVEVKRGQVGWSEVKLAKRYHWSRNKLRRFLFWLEKEQQIVQQKNTVSSILTIVNYDKYQGNDTADDTAERQQKDSRRYTNKNDKNENNDKKQYTRKYFIDHKDEILKEAKTKYPNKDVDRVLKEFIDGTEIKDYKHKNHKLAFFKWISNSKHYHSYYPIKPQQPEPDEELLPDHTAEFEATRKKLRNKFNLT